MWFERALGLICWSDENDLSPTAESTTEENLPFTQLDWHWNLDSIVLLALHEVNALIACILPNFWTYITSCDPDLKTAAARHVKRKNRFRDILWPFTSESDLTQGSAGVLVLQLLLLFTIWAFSGSKPGKRIWSHSGVVGCVFLPVLKNFKEWNRNSCMV